MIWANPSPINLLTFYLGDTSIVKFGEVWLSGEIGGGGAGVKFQKKNKFYNFY